MTMPFLQNIPPFIFFTGKGGVGKTSLACATAVWPFCWWSSSMILPSSSPTNTC